MRNQRRANVMAKRTGQKSVLILGAGYVAGPLVDYLTRDEDVHVTVASELYGQGKASFSHLWSQPIVNVWQWREIEREGEKIENRCLGLQAIETIGY